jgi:DNA-binding LacI/PurR family transcriptional regulator
VAGVALMTSELDAPLFDQITRKLIAVDFDNPGPAGERTSNVRVDYPSGIEQAVAHLVSLGHRRIAHIAGASRIPSGAVRREAFLASFARYLPGEPEPPVFEGDFRLDGGRRAASELLSSGELPTAVVVANDMMALGAMQELRAAGLSVPRDISIVGFDDIAFSSLCDPPLTTVRSPRDEIGRRAVEALISMIERPEEPGVEIRIPTRLVVRSSTAPPRPNGR